MFRILPKTVATQLVKRLASLCFIVMLPIPCKTCFSKASFTSRTDRGTNVCLIPFYLTNLVNSSEVNCGPLSETSDLLPHQAREVKRRTPVEAPVWHHNEQVKHHCSGLSCTFHTLSVLHWFISTVHLSLVTDAMALEWWLHLVGNVSSTVPCPEMTATH